MTRVVTISPAQNAPKASATLHTMFGGTSSRSLLRIDRQASQDPASPGTSKDRTVTRTARGRTMAPEAASDHIWRVVMRIGKRPVPRSRPGTTKRLPWRRGLRWSRDPGPRGPALPVQSYLPGAVVPAIRNKLTWLALAVILVSTAGRAQAQDSGRRPIRVTLGAGISALIPSDGSAPSERGMALLGSVAAGLAGRTFLELEARAHLAGGSSAVIPGCPTIPGISCDERTLVPSELLGADLRVGLAIARWLRFSLGPALGWAPGLSGGSRVVMGFASSAGLTPFATGRGPGAGLRAVNFLSPLGEVTWSLAGVLTIAL